MFALRAASTTQGMPTNREDFGQLVEDRYKWKIDALATEKVIRQLEAWRLISVINDKYAGEMLRLFGAKTDDALSYVSENGHQALVSNGLSGGVEWFKKVFGSTDFWVDLHNDPLASVDDESDATGVNPSDDLIPASDRIVTRSDNRAEIEVMESDFHGLVEELDSNNEVSIALGDEKDVINGELRTAETLISQPAFRLSKLSSLVLPALRYLAEKFASGAIGEMAKRLIAAIMGLM